MTDLFDDSRRLTGSNLYFDGTGAALEVARGVVFDDATLARWCDNISAARVALGWPDGLVVARRHRTGASLAFAAPMDQLYAATEVNEWAWRAAVACDPFSPREKVPEGRMREESLLPPLQGEGRGGEGSARDDSTSSYLVTTPSLEEGGFETTDAIAAFAHLKNNAANATVEPHHTVAPPSTSALQTLQNLADNEANPALIALHDAAVARALPFLSDDDAVSIGAGEGSQTWPITALPSPGAVDWPKLHAIPTALVTGSNGKTTTVRMIAAMTRAHGWHTAHSCTDGVFFDNVALESGDYSGPTGARTAMRQPQAQAAVLETARGGLLRRGLPLQRADVAVVTNISPDHFGEYGIHDLDDLGTVKLTVARAIDHHGLLVLNADDPIVLRRSAPLTCPLGWFALDADASVLVAHRVQAGATCGVRDGRLLLSHHGADHDLGAVADMPVTLAGRAVYNIYNAAAAALAACSLGVVPAVIALTLSRFGATGDDNPGRLQHWRFGALDVYVDYAHNPDGLCALLDAVGANGRGARRLSLLLGHAGNREDDDLRAVAAVAASYAPALVVLKDIGGYERGRAPGEVAAIMRQTLADAGIAGTAVDTLLDEVAAARRPLQWARDGDLVVLPVHEPAARIAVVALLDTLRDLVWRPGTPLLPLQGPDT